MISKSYGLSSDQPLAHVAGATATAIFGADHRGATGRRQWRGRNGATGYTSNIEALVMGRRDSHKGRKGTSVSVAPAVFAKTPEVVSDADNLRLTPVLGRA